MGARGVFLLLAGLGTIGAAFAWRQRALARHPLRDPSDGSR